VSGTEDLRTVALRLLCDAMLARLGHWLRAAGYGTLVAAHRTGDHALLTRALADGRVVLTRDRQLLGIRAADGHALLLRRDDLAGQAAEITNPLGIDWLRDPFSRCLLCNVALRPAPPLARGRLPEAVRDEFDDINQCPQCDRLYWAGGHVRRMRRRLERWREGDFA
jgi:uncharacterized protein with PIN domain